MVEKLTKKSGVVVWAQEMMYKEMVQTVLLYGRERWVVTEVMLTVLEGFNNQVARKIVGKTAQSSGDDMWE